MTVEDRVKEQFPTLFVTLVSVLIGLFYADLVSVARERVALWPLSYFTLRNWAQIFAMGSSAFTVWVVFAYVGISRRHLPTLGDSLVAFLTPIPLLIGNSLVGGAAIWPWFYYASFYLGLAIVNYAWQLRLAFDEPELAKLGRLVNPRGHISVLYIGVVFYGFCGWADSKGWLTPLEQVLVAASCTPAALTFSYLFIREWRSAIGVA